MIGNDPAYPLDGEYTLTQDIDASASANWNSGAGFEPIGSDSTPFTGTFDGQGYIITDLEINRPGENCVGLFGSVGYGGILEHICLEGILVTGLNSVGRLAGRNEGVILNCYATGSVTGTDDIVGGLVGYNDGGTVSECYVTGFVTGTDDTVGGLVGYNDGGTVAQCYATGSVTGQNYVGGLVGWLDDGTISECYSTGAVTGTTADIGGLVGYSTSGAVDFSLWDIETSGITESAGGTGLPTNQMKDPGTYDAWDFDTVWYMLEGGSYPYLRNLPRVVVPDVSALSEADAIAALEAAGLAAQVTYEYSEVVPAGFVIRQDISKGESINAGVPVTIFVSGDAPPEPEDIDRDGRVNAVDVQLVINAALGLNVGDLVPDVDGSGSVNAVDVQLVINAALGV